MCTAIKKKQLNNKDKSHGTLTEKSKIQNKNVDSLSFISTYIKFKKKQN